MSAVVWGLKKTLERWRVLKEREREREREKRERGGGQSDW